MSRPLFKQEFYLKADNEQEVAHEGLLSFADISRSGIEIVKRSKTFKVIELIAFQFPYSSNLNSWSENVSSLIVSDEFKSFISDTDVTFSVSDSSVTLIPKSLYSEKEKTQSFEFLFGNSDDFLIESQEFSNSDTIGVFGIPKRIAEVISEPIQSSYLNWVDGLPNDFSKARANVVLTEKHFALVIQKDGKLISSNWFEYSKHDDVIYYLMASLETLKILHSEVDVVLNGKIEKGDKIYTSIAKFISKLSFGKRPKNLTYSYSFKEVTEHRFPFIFAAACA